MPTILAAWRHLGAVRPSDLAAARVELHWAVQVPAALAIARAAPRPEFAHHALVLDPERDAFLSALVPGKRAYRAGLRVNGTRLVLLDANHSLVEDLPLAGRTLADALSWLERATERYTGVAGAPLRAPDHELPAHPVQSGGRFLGADPEPALELARWFGAARAALAPIARDLGALPPRVWPHHFDMDVVVEREGRRVGLGFSPGDESVPEPYFYVLPWDAPDAPPALESPFEWTSEGWTGALLRGSRVAGLSSDSQAELVARFYAATLDGLA